jgi:hypothetical protein
MDTSYIIHIIHFTFLYKIYMKFNLKGSNLEDWCKTIQSRNTTKTVNHCTRDSIHDASV